MIKESYYLIKYKYEHGVYTLQEMHRFVELGWITPTQFHEITTYSYEGTKNRG